MSKPRVLLAKTTRPSFSGVLPRLRLFDLLDNASQCRAIWIHGPPGSGKTTLVASFLDARKLDSIWYQIDESDSDIASFFFHLDLAIAAHGTRKRPALPRLTPQHHNAVHAFARRYAQALFNQFTGRFVIVLDGYQMVSPQSMLQDVVMLACEEIPSSGSIVLISRGEPPASMVRMRANRTLDVVGWRDLQLTPEELGAIAAQRGHRLDADELRALHDRTQGWAAGLILMLEQAAGEAVDAPTDLSTPQLVFDYLAGEIFQQSDKSTQEVLLATAYLPQMTGDMARTLSARDDADERLANLYRNNYFVSLKQAQPKVIYEYHPLLRECMLARANATFDKSRRQQLHQLAAELLEAEGLVAEAALLLREIGDWERVAALIRHHARAMLDSGRSETLVQWVESLPAEFQDQNPWTLYWLGVARIYVSPRESRKLQQRAYELFSRQATPDLRGLLLTCSSVMDAILYEVDDFSLADAWIEIMARLLRENPDLVSGALEARIACSLFTSMAARQPHHPDIEYWGERAYRASLAQADINVRVWVEPRVALGIAYGGHFPKALAIIEGVRELVAKHEVPPLALTMLKLVEATYYMLTAQKERCYKAAREGLQIEKTEGVTVLSRQLLAYGAGGALAAGDLETAEAFLKESAALPGMPARFDQCLYHLFSTWLAMRQNDMLRAYQQQKLALRMAVEVGIPVFEVLCRIAAAYVHYQSKELQAVLAHFQRVYDIARHIRNRVLEFTGLMAYAYVALDSGRRPRSGMRALRQALAVGKPRNYLAYPLWLPGPLSRLCGIAIENAIEPEFVASLIRERELELDARQSALIDWPWPLKVQTLGQFRILRNGAPISFTGKAQRRPLDLLKVTIAFGGADVSEERVIEALWPRIDGDSAHQSFTSTLHRLRKLLGEEQAVLLSEGKLRLDGRYIWTDVWAFEQAGANISQLLRPGLDPDAEQLADFAEKFLGRYAGSFLGSESEQAWVLPLRDRLRQRFVRTIGEVARYYQGIAKSELAVDFLERALERDDTAESLYRSLMDCYAAIGRRTEAIEAYGRCRRVLAATLHVEPSPETTAIYQALTRST